MVSFIIYDLVPFPAVYKEPAQGMGDSHGSERKWTSSVFIRLCSLLIYLFLDSFRKHW